MTTQRMPAAVQAAAEEEAYGHYSMVLEWDPEDRIYVVTVPELPGCQAHGETYEEAARKGRDAIMTWIDGARHFGNPVPSPRHWSPDSDAPAGRPDGRDDH